MNPTLMALGLAKPTLQIEVVTRQVRLVPSHEQSRLEASHHRRHLPPDRVRFGLQAISQRRECDATFIARAARRIESRPDLRAERDQGRKGVRRQRAKRGQGEKGSEADSGPRSSPDFTGLRFDRARLARHWMRAVRPPCNWNSPTKQTNRRIRNPADGRSWPGFSGTVGLSYSHGGGLLVDGFFDKTLAGDIALGRG